jgi:hypothetical protein
MSAEHSAPTWWVPMVTRLQADPPRLASLGSKLTVKLPPAGAWRSVSELDPGGAEQILAVATRFGPLTAAGRTKGGELLQQWHWMIEELRLLTPAWTETGEVNELDLVEGARDAARDLQERVLLGAGPDRFRVGAFGEWVFQCPDMLTWWTLQGVRSVFHLAPMRRCRWCSVWFSLAGLRADMGFCSAVHRAALHQKRRAPTFWAEGF